MTDHLTVLSADGLEIHLPICGLGGRSYAFIIDWHIRLLGAMAWLLVFVLLLRIFGSEEAPSLDFASLSGLGYALVAPPLAIYFLYHPVLEVLMHGRTPGKRMAGVCIVTSDGHTPGTGPLLMRNVFRLLDSLPMFYALGIGVVLSTRQQVRVGDLAAGTVLVYEEKLAGAKRPAFAPYGQESALPPAQQDLVRELLARWKELSPRVRLRLGRQVLEKLGNNAAADTDRDDLNAIHARLLSLRGRDHA